MASRSSNASDPQGVNHEVVLDVSKDTLEGAPGFDKDNWPDIHDRSWVGDVYRRYGREPYWKDDPVRPLTQDQSIT